MKTQSLTNVQEIKVSRNDSLFHWSMINKFQRYWKINNLSLQKNVGNSPITVFPCEIQVDRSSSEKNGGRMCRLIERQRIG